MRADGEDELQYEHDADDLVANLAKHHTAGVGVVRDVRVLELHLADHVAGVHGDEANANRQDDAGHHAESGEGSGETETAEGDGRDDQHDGEALPAEAVEVSLALGRLLLLVVLVRRGHGTHLADLIVELGFHVAGV